MRQIKFLFIIVFLNSLLFNTRLISQGLNTTYIPKIVPPSPNAASLSKFGDIPVSPYTGTTDVTIPIFNIQAKSLSVPVSLSYHTGGIRLGEESGWVGLGWALNAGGMISRTINDKDDFFNDYFNDAFVALPPMPEVKGKLVTHPVYALEEYYGDYMYTFFCRYKVYSEFGTTNFFNAFTNMFISPTTYDLEPDTYSFNFLGRSGKFIIGRDKKVILQKQENLKIDFASDGSSFTITDEQGNKYYFLDKEYSKPSIGGAQHISSWLLSKVVTQDNNVVTFNYDSDNTWSTVQGIVHETLRYGVPGYETPIYSNDPGEDYLNKTLQTIDFSNGEIQFQFDGDRADLQNGKKLNNIKIYSKDENGLNYLKEDQLYYSYFTPGGSSGFEFNRLRLDSIKEVSGGISLPPYSFIYNMPQQDQLMGKHYSSVDHWGYYNGVSNAIYGNYKLGFTPGFSGYAIFGAPGNVHSQALSIEGANREPDPIAMQAFSLQKVSYPTGGYTAFEYEPNYYDYYKSKAGRGGHEFENPTLLDKSIPVVINQNGDFSGTVDLSDMYLPSDANVTVAFRAASLDSLNVYHLPPGDGEITFTFQNNKTDITDAGLFLSGNTYSSSMPLSSPGVYSWSAHIGSNIKVPEGFIEIRVTISYKVSAAQQSTLLMAGGLRIKSIKDYTASGKLAKEKTYDYGYKQDKDGNGVKPYSYGRLMGYLSYARQEILEVPNQSGYGYGTSLTRYSSNFSAFTSQSSGNIVGYDQVTEYTIDSANNIDNGKIVYSFYNSADTSFTYAGYRFPGVLNLPNNLNGLPLSKAVFAKDGVNYRPVSSIVYNYHSANRVIYNAFKYMHMENSPDNQAGGTAPCQDYGGGYYNRACSCPNQIDSATYEIAANFYPAISSEVVLLDSTVEKTYDQNDTTRQLIAVTRNYYDNPKHYQLTRSSFTDSKHNRHVTFIKYPQDYLPVNSNTIGNTVVDSMIQKNIVSAPIEKSDSLYLSGSSDGFITGAEASVYKLLTPDKIIALNKQYKLDLTAPVNDFQPLSFSGNTINKDSRYRQMISFQKYDDAYNLQEYTAVDGVAVAFLWDYFEKYPVAKIMYPRTFSASVNYAYTSFETDNQGNWSFTPVIINDPKSPTGGKVDKITDHPITIQGLNYDSTYIVSYWSKNSVAFTVNGSVGTGGQKIYGWRYYEHKLTHKTSLTIQMPASGGNGNDRIDELRLYPFGAQMTTYAYDPLIGMTSQCDQNNMITYYEYDGLGRLTTIRNVNRNIIKKFAYDYAGQKFNPNKFYNQVQTQTFAKNDCTDPNYAGSEVADTVMAGIFESDSSQAEADSLAIADISAHGQSNANTNGTCLPLLSFILNNYDHIAGFTITLTAVYDSTKIYTIAFPEDSDSSLSLEKIPQGRYNITISKSGNTDSFLFTVSGPSGDIQVNSAQGSWVNVPINSNTFDKISIGIPQ
jgi:hypothetical protein